MPFGSKYPEELSAEQHRELETLLKTTKNVKVYRRTKLLIYLYGGRTTEFIEEHIGYNRRSQYYWLNRYSHEGIQGLYDHFRSGRPLKSGEERESELYRSEELTPSTSSELSRREPPEPDQALADTTPETNGVGLPVLSRPGSAGVNSTVSHGLSEPARFTLSQMHRNHPKAYLRNRAQMVLLQAKGYSVKTISEVVGATVGTVRSTLARYEQFKLGGLYRQAGTGKSQGILTTHFTKIHSWLTEGPKVLGYRFAIWTTRSLRHEIDKQFNRRFSREWIRQNLHKLYHYSWTRAKKLYAYRDSKDRQAFQQKFQGLLEQARQGEILLLVEDETILDLYGKVGYSWSPIGETQQVFHPGQKENIVVFGAVNPLTGQSHYRIDEIIDQNSTLRFLKQIHSYYDRQHCPIKRAIVLDKHPGHKAQTVTNYVTSNELMELVFTPTQSPDLNPIERLWDWLEDRMIKNAFFERADDLKKATQHFFSYIAGVKEQVVQLMGEPLSPNTG